MTLKQHLLTVNLLKLISEAFTLDSFVVFTGLEPEQIINIPTKNVKGILISPVEGQMCKGHSCCAHIRGQGH